MSGLENLIFDTQVHPQNI